MTRLSADAASIELANYDTQFVVTDLTMGDVEIYLEHECDTNRKDFAVGNFTREEIAGLADLLYLRYSRNVPLHNEVVNYDAE